MDVVHRGVLSSQRNNEMCALFSIGEFVNGPELTSLHRIVIGRSSKALADELRNHLELINVVDSGGRTPLWWAARRENITFAKTLIEQGADIRLANCESRTVIYECTRVGSAQTC